jgi:NAD(P)-dependent dehydrogenase (short-subunit alcohol dehydrogenase family)
VELRDRVAAVTGGGRGLGRAIALRLARDGADLILAGRDAAELEAARSEVVGLGRRALAVVADVADEGQVGRLVAEAVNAFGRIDVLVNNAGVAGPTAPVQAVTRAEWDGVLAVNLTGAFLCCRAVLPGMLERRDGVIVNVSSVAGQQAYPLRSPYASSKWGLIGLTLTLAREAGPYNVRVNAVCPGPVEGERMRSVIARRAREQGRSEAEVEQDYVAATLLGRFVRPDDVAAVVALLASPAGASITGQALGVTAGYGV